ncbi:Endo alpha-1-4 polygalactosaminidase precursor [Penicillium riverlandense]|uniref:Endo alpha-1-4 polygalactosaminidase precursor n=1 Tax=Penicillium riverlandense TaxID=1903569 RepID=UPI002548E399|nr:Endo alpha-1-4 polygalactosaminidase precursor [Penicillium riverlandense]KAJ5820270.1 Endo alpha-1-4 polygalactosaminidase precursor [Penicillium riverlandense]
MAKQSATSGWWTWSSKKKALVLSLVALIVVALGVGLGVGLGIGLKQHHGKRSGNAPTSNGGNGGANTTVKWQPAAGTKWQIELLNPLTDTSVDAPVYDIDMFDNRVKVICDLQNMGRKVICYFSAGTYENWRPDASDFRSSDFGNKLPDWSGEKWLDTNSKNVREVMKTRLDLAKKKGCDGVDPDNIDAYDNSNGLGLTKADAINYVNFLAKEADARGLAIGLKNGGDIIDSVIDNMQWSVNEQCAQYDECAIFDPFIQANKPVFHIEYPKSDGTNNNNAVTAKQRSAACNAANEKGFSTVIKNMDLDNWVEYCS